MNCPNCGAPLREGAAFCTSCGTAVQERKPKLKSTLPMDEPVAPVQQPAAPAPSVQQAAPVAGTVYEALEKTAPKEESVPVYRAEPAPAYDPVPRPEEKPKKKRADGPSRVVPVLHKLRAWLAVILAVGCIALLFFPWFRTCLEGEATVTIDKEEYEPSFGGGETDVSILDVVQFSDLDDVVDIDLDSDDALESALEDNDIKAKDYVERMLLPEGKDGKRADISEVKLFGVKLPTGVVAMAPQLLCILLMVIFFIIGVIRVFASEPFADGAPKTGWLKAGGIVGVVMSVITGAEVFAANRFFQDLVDKFASESFDAELELTLGLLVPFFLFAAASVAVILLATHWGKNKMKEDASF